MNLPGFGRLGPVPEGHRILAGGKTALAVAAAGDDVVSVASRMDAGSQPELGFRRPAGAGGKSDGLSGGGAGGWPPANVLGTFSAGLKPVPRPIQATDNSGEPSFKAVEVGSKPVEVVSKPVDLSSKPVDLDAKPVKVTSEPVKVSSKPVEVSVKPVEMTSEPVKVTSKPVEVTSKPVNLASKTVKLVPEQRFGPKEAKIAWRASAKSICRIKSSGFKTSRHLDCAGRAQRRQRFLLASPGNTHGESGVVRCESGVALRLPPQSK
jgi:hypothetical protein